MSNVYVGSARIDEHGNAYNGVAGDQTGGEVATQKYYTHTSGWRVFRAKDRSKAVKIAENMVYACNNNHIGYDQWNRDSLYNAAKNNKFDCSWVDKDVETDCSALVRVCCAYAGIFIDNFRTYNEPGYLLRTGEFEELEPIPYSKRNTNPQDYLAMGDILVTPCSGHTVVVITDGKYSDMPRAISSEEEREMTLIKKGSKGSEVKTLQRLLNAVIDAGLEVDGDCGNNTVSAIKSYQSKRGLEADGQCGNNTWNKLLKQE